MRLSRMLGNVTLKTMARNTCRKWCTLNVPVHSNQLRGKLSSKAGSDIIQNIPIYDRAFVNGKWMLWNDVFAVYSPASGDHIADVVDVKKENANFVVGAAYDAFKLWRDTMPKERSDILRNLYNIILREKDTIADIITMEMGKPLGEAKAEVVYAASFIEWFSEEAKRIYGDIYPGMSRSNRIMNLKQPVGVCLLVTPWNFPLAMLTRKMGAALAAGCTVISKPAEDSPLTATYLAHLSLEAGLPNGVFNVIPSGRDSTPDLVRAMCEHPKVAKISFTGSTEVGKILIRQSAFGVKRLCLELGGNAPFIVFDSADVHKAVVAAVNSKFRNAGQTCVCTNRFLVQVGVYDEFCRLLREEVAKLKVGDGFDPEVDIGPLVNKAAADKVERLVSDAKAKGATITLGGGRISETFYQPTIVSELTSSMLIAQQEIFGPVASIFKFSTEDEAIELANDTPFGLAGYFFSRDHSQIWRVAERLETGMVGVNEGLLSTTMATFSGIKESGLGRESGKYGIDEYLNTKYVLMGGL